MAEPDDDDGLFGLLRASTAGVKSLVSSMCFVHGFLVHGSTLELWVFDRAGAYSSERLDLAQNPDLLMRILAGYSVNSDEEAGSNTFCQKPAT